MRMQYRLNPFSLPIAFFTATSATCVTGLSVVDTGRRFTTFGQGAILAMIQLGGLGIMTYTSLVFYLLRRRIRLTDRTAVAQGLLHDMPFHLGRFLLGIVASALMVAAPARQLAHRLATPGFIEYPPL